MALKEVESCISHQPVTSAPTPDRIHQPSVLPMGNVAYRGEQALPTDPRTYLQLHSTEVPGSSQYYTVASVEPRNDFVISGFEAEFRGAVPGSFGVRSSNQNLKANDCEIIIKSQQRFHRQGLN